MDNQLIIEEAIFYLENNFTVAEAAARQGISKSTLQKHFQKLASIDPDLYNEVRAKKEIKQQQGRILGGQIGKRKPNYTYEEANKIADILISREYTLDELVKYTKYPRTTLYEMLTSSYIDIDKKKQVEAIFMVNHKHTTLAAFNKKNRGLK